MGLGFLLCRLYVYEAPALRTAQNRFPGPWFACTDAKPCLNERPVSMLFPWSVDTQMGNKMMRIGDLSY